AEFTTLRLRLLKVASSRRPAGCAWPLPVRVLMLPSSGTSPQRSPPRHSRRGTPPLRARDVRNPPATNPSRHGETDASDGVCPCETNGAAASLSGRLVNKTG